jgi:exonuclease III
MLLQEVTHEEFSACVGYNAYVNIGTEGRGTAILIRQQLTFSIIDKLPSGRGIAGLFGQTYIVNIYAPSGAARRKEREEFYHTEIPYLFRAMPERYILGGDFNCVLSRTDCTGEAQISKGLEKFVREFAAEDAWSGIGDRPSYTHYTSSGASRIDRIYLSKALMACKTSAETRVAAFTDHSALLVRLTMNAQNHRHGKGRWKLNNMLLQEETRTKYRRGWEDWKVRIPQYRNKLEWWDKFAKTRTQHFFKQEGRTQAAERRQMENFYYQCIYDLISEKQRDQNITTRLKYFKDKIMDLQRIKTQKIILEAQDQGPVQNERATLYYLCKARRKRTGRMINQITDEGGRKLDTHEEIMRMMTEKVKEGFKATLCDKQGVERLCE